MGTFLPQIEDIAEKIEVWFYSRKSFTKMDKIRNKEDRVGCKL
jgi:hypothetical protein